MFSIAFFFFFARQMSSAVSGFLSLSYSLFPKNLFTATLQSVSWQSCEISKTSKKKKKHQKVVLDSLHYCVKFQSAASPTTFFAVPEKKRFYLCNCDTNPHFSQYSVIFSYIYFGVWIKLQVLQCAVEKGTVALWFAATSDLVKMSNCAVTKIHIIQ